MYKVFGRQEKNKIIIYHAEKYCAFEISPLVIANIIVDNRCARNYSYGYVFHMYAM